MFLISMKQTKVAVRQGELTSLRVYKSGRIFYTKGRVGPSLEWLLGIRQMPVIMPEARLAKLLMWDSHNEDHRRQASDTLARSKDRAWIVRGAYLAKSVCKTCPYCRLNDRRQSQLEMLRYISVSYL